MKETRKIYHCIKTSTSYHGLTQGNYYESINEWTTKESNIMGVYIPSQKMIRYLDDNGLIMNHHLDSGYLEECDKVESMIVKMCMNELITVEKRNDLLTQYMMDMLDSQDFLTKDKKSVIELDVNSSDMTDVCYKVVSKFEYINAYLDDEEEFNEKFDITND